MSIDVIARATAGPFAATCVLLAFSGASKIRRPIGTRAAAAALGLPASPAAVRTLGIVESIVAIAGLAVGGAAAAAVAIVYGTLTVAAWRLLVQSPGTPCGCLGASDAPATKTHIVVNVVAAITAALATAAGSPLSAVGSSVWARVAFVLFVGCCASLVASMLDTLPALNPTAPESVTR